MKRARQKQLENAKPKYRAKPTVIDGKRFDSKKEARRYLELKLLQRAGQISDLRCQVTFRLAVNGFHVCSYVADFVYFENGSRTVEDVKGFLTPTYRIKKKLMKAVHGIKIKET